METNRLILEIQWRRGNLNAFGNKVLEKDKLHDAIRLVSANNQDGG
jgi:hypothetical protein